MNDFNKIQNLLQEKADYQARINLIPYDGSPEIKENSSGKYIYIRKRVGSRLTSTYVDIYSDDLYQLLLRNFKELRELRKQVRKIEKRLADLGYEANDLDVRVIQNLDFARANMKSNIYDQAVLEGVATSFPQTEDIIDNGTVSGMTANDIQKILNLKHAWEFILETDVLQAKTDYYLLCHIAKVVNEATEMSTEVLKNAILKANHMVYEKSQSYKELEGMGTTAVVAYVQEDILYWAHVGDSRLYRYGEDGLHRMTKDHSMVQQLVEAGTITEEEVIHHPKRNMLTRAIGVYETVEVDTGVVEVHQNDRILLCSDGLSGYIEESKIEQVLSEENNESRALEDLVHLVYDAGARDNVTIVLGRI